MKYLLFAGDKYYPVGGIHDLKDNGDSVQELINSLPDITKDALKFETRITWWHIIDRDTMQMVAWSTDQGQAGIFEGEDL